MVCDGPAPCLFPLALGRLLPGRGWVYSRYVSLRGHSAARLLGFVFSAIRKYWPVIASRAETTYAIELVSPAEILEDFGGGYLCIRDFLRGRPLGRRGVWRQFGTMPLLTSPCRFATLLWLGGRQDSYPPPRGYCGPGSRFLPPTVVRECGPVTAYRRPKYFRDSVCPWRRDRRRAQRRLLSRTQPFEGVLASP